MASRKPKPIRWYGDDDQPDALHAWQGNTRVASISYSPGGKAWRWSVLGGPRWTRKATSDHDAKAKCEAAISAIAAGRQ